VRLIDDQTIRETRALLDENLLHSCDIQTDTGGLVNGAHKPAWTPAGALVPCALSPAGGGGGSMEADQNQAIGTWRVRFQAGTAVTAANRLIVSGVDQLTGAAFSITLMVTSVAAPMTTEMARVVSARTATKAEL
jgi:hypothetical protein